MAVSVNVSWLSDFTECSLHITGLCVALNPLPYGRSSLQGESIQARANLREDGVLCTSILYDRYTAQLEESLLH